MYANYGQDNYVAVIHPPEPFLTSDGEVGGDEYVIAFHYDELPAFDSKEFKTLEEAKAWAKEELGIRHWRNYYGQFTSHP